MTSSPPYALFLEKKTPERMRKITTRGRKSLFQVPKKGTAKNGYLSLAQVLPCRFKWYNLSLFQGTHDGYTIKFCIFIIEQKNPFVNNTMIKI